MATKTYSQLAKEIEALKAQADKQLTVEKAAAVERLNKVIAEYGLAASDLTFGTRTVGGKLAVKKSTASLKNDVKFSDADGNTWSGRGPRPAWLRTALAAGKSLDSFTVGSVAAVKPVAKKSTAKAAGGGLPPKYAHPNTGVTWTGRGPTPQWLKLALRKRGSKIEDFLVGASPAAPAPEAKFAAPAAPVPKASTKSVKAAPVKQTAKAAKNAPAKAAAAPVAATVEVEAATKPPAKAPAKKAAPGKKATAKAAAAKAEVKTPGPVAKKAVKSAAKKAPAKSAAKSLPAKAEGAAKTTVKASKVNVTPVAPAGADVPETAVGVAPSPVPAVELDVNAS